MDTIDTLRPCFSPSSSCVCSRGFDMGKRPIIGERRGSALTTDGPAIGSGDVDCDGVGSDLVSFERCAEDCLSTLGEDLERAGNVTFAFFSSTQFRMCSGFALIARDQTETRSSVGAVPIS